MGTHLHFALRRISILCASMAAALVATPDSDGRAATTPEPANPPLGILIAPADRAPAAPQRRSSEQPVQRPLGILMGPGAAPPPRVPALPSAPFPASRTFSAPPNEPSIRPAGQGHSDQRPLGILMETAPAYSPPATTAVSPQQLAPLPDTHPTRQQSAPIDPTPYASSPERPLGTLLGPPVVSTSGAAAPVAPISSAPAPVSAPPPVGTPEEADSDDPPIHLLADEMSFDREKGLVVASGNVQIRFGQRTLIADRILYDQNRDVASASGNVTLREPTGERVFGDKMEISGDLKDAVIHNIGLILKDKSRIAGTGARRSSGRVTELRKGIYSPCKLCDDDPSAPPLWQLKAVKVVHDQDQKIIEYRDVWLEFFGFPVAYTPYFRHPDPTVRRKSGFLFPRIGSSSDFGTIIETPYFWAISENEDATIRPIVMTDEAPVLAAEYRKRFVKGTLDVDASITDNSEEEFSTEKGEYGVRGHIDAEARFDLNRTWRWGADIKRATDDTYMRRYGFGSPTSLDSQLFIEGFRKQNYFSAKSLVFQGLQEGDEHDESPVVLPLVDYNYVGEQDRAGGRTIFDFNFLALTRNKGTDTRRLAFHPKWERPFQGPFGDLYRFETGANLDLYHVNSLSHGSTDGTYSGVSHRLFPYVNLEWRLPMVKTQGTVRQTLEPIVSIAMAPNGGNSDKIPNEDSTDFEFDETNLFSVNRFSGIDRVEGGPRVNYGFKWGVFGKEGGSSTAFIGQTYRLRTDDTFGIGSGLEDNLSDIVASVAISPSSSFQAFYRTRFASDNLSPNRNEVQFSAGVPAFKVSGNYTFLDHQAESEFSGREEMSLSAKSRINRYWSSSLSAIRDMESSEMRSLAFDATYENECVVLTSRLSRTFFEDRDVKPTDAITFHLVLKTLGEVRSGASISSN